MASNTTTEYLLGPSADEGARLLAQSELLNDETQWLLDRVDVPVGGRGVDLACGPLGILPQLAARVGPCGAVVGVDRSPEMLDHAAGLVRERGLRNVELVAGDATATGLPRAAFDLVHVRLLLVNVPDPVAVVTEAAALVRPGGTVALHEVDWISWQCEPPHPAWDRLRELLAGLWRARGLDTCIGRRLPSLLRGAGLRDVRATAHAGIDGSDVWYQRLLLTFVERFADRIVDGGLARRDEIDALASALTRHLAQPDTIVIRALSVQAWGRRP